MPKTIVASSRHCGLNIIRAAFETGYATHLVSTDRFQIWRRGIWLGIRDRIDGRSVVVRLYPRCKGGRRNKQEQRYRVLGQSLKELPSLWKLLEDEGIFVGCPSAYNVDGLLYLNRVVAAVGGLCRKAGLSSLCFLRGGDRRRNIVVHHRNHDESDDRVENLHVMIEMNHDDLHSVQEIRASCFLPAAKLVKTTVAGDGTALPPPRPVDEPLPLSAELAKHWESLKALP